jgi:hypothetical protein
VGRAWRTCALAVVATIATGCFDDTITSSFQGAHDAGGDGDAAPETSTATDACPILVSTLVVVVTDAASGVDVCFATVTASSGASTIPLAMQGTPASCAYSAGQIAIPPGTYTVSVIAPGYEPAALTGIVVSSGPCGTSAPTVTLQLTAAPPDAGSDASPADAATGAG